MKKNYYSIIIPVYNSTKSLKIIVESITKEFQNKLFGEFEIIMVDDCSTNPESAIILKEINEHYSKVKVVFLRKNFGQHAALLCGMSYAEGNYILTMDDDLQHSPELFEDLIKQNSHDVVYAKFSNIKSTFVKILMSRIRNYINQKTYAKVGIYISSFALYKREIVDVILSQCNTYPLFGSMAFGASDDIINTVFEHRRRLDGRSGYTWKKLFKLFMNILFNNTSLVVRAVFISSMILFIAGLILFIPVFTTDSNTFYSILDKWIIIVLFFFSIVFLLFGVGMLGEYLRRILMALEKKPLFVIKEILEKNLDE